MITIYAIVRCAPGQRPSLRDSLGAVWHYQTAAEIVTKRDDLVACAIQVEEREALATCEDLFHA